ncbi:hypothetical protein [Mariniflexile sp.]|uniref:hypothetical protein n=1 Tax=Mariniflexile sp. TaxID=1979402 RepID=UPI00356898C2
MKDDLVVTIIISFLFLSVGFLLLHFEQITYGVSFFVLLPFIIGFITGNSAIKKISLWGHTIALIIFFVLLILGGLEGVICILMAMPLIIVAIALGMLFKYYFKKNKIDHQRKNMAKSSVLPFLIFVFFAYAEKILTKEGKDIIEIKSEIILPYSATQVYDKIKQVDTLDAEKPFLMKLDLPVPQRCVLEEEKVGALRVCYFDGGKIVERITEIERGKFLNMEVIDYQVTGRKWLGFKSASYEFENLVGGKFSKMTRTTTYTSKLKPRFYWRLAEKIGIKQEHEYVFRNLRKDLENSF